MDSGAGGVQARARVKLVEREVRVRVGRVHVRRVHVRRKGGLGGRGIRGLEEG